jgi:DNA-binding response OmpR family regulator
MPSQTVLVVDDEEIDRKAIRRILNRHYELLEAGGFEEGLAVFGANRDAIGLVIADISLPDGNGCELAIKLREQKPDLRVLFVSGLAGAEVCRFYGVDVTGPHYLGKPFRPEALRGQVQKVLTAVEPFPRFDREEQAPRRQSAGSGSDSTSQ